MTKTINHTFFYEHKPETVWEYLTNAQLMAQWLMPTDFQPIVGFDFTFKTKPIPGFEFDGNIYCKVLAITPLKKLIYSWKGGPGDGTTNLDSIVEWTLSEKDNGTELHLKHSGLMENLSIYEAMTKGWLQNMAKINDHINAQHDTTKA